MSLKIYSQTNENDELLESILLEGFSYILDLSTFSEKERRNWVEQERLEKHITYHPKNTIATIKFVNVVGNVNLFGRKVDVRSPKLYDGYGGNEQFKLLVEDLNRISSQLTYSYVGVSTVIREVDMKSLNPSDIERFDYLYQFTFNFPPGNNLNSLVTRALTHPNKKTISFEEIVPISKSKNISRNFLKKIGKVQHFSEIVNSHPLFQSQLVKRIQSASGKSLIPMNVSVISNKESYDTPENRFVKFFLQDIISICHRIEQKIRDKIFLDNVIKLKNEVEKILQWPFFEAIGRLNYLPDSSSVLLNKAGYRELYYHFVQSKFGFKSIVDNLKQISMTAGLKDMASLYEIWTFFEIGKRVFEDKEINQQFSTKGIRNGDVMRGISWKAQDVELKFNFSYMHRNNTSYSLNLRPDISLTINGKLYLFDAKYKFLTNIRNIDEEVEIQRIIKAEDIHKMHAYLDAIESAIFSVAIYPGNRFIFYNKEGKTISSKVSDVTYSGVGAIPLSPNSDNSIMDTFISKLLLELT